MPLSYPIRSRTLDNGLRVVVSEDHLVPTVTVNIWVDVGSRHEQAGATGLAHLFEHLMFQGSENVAEGEHFSRIMSAGGQLNATTWFDRTAYFATVPTGALELVLWLEADRHRRLLPAVTQANLDNQRDVVKEEKRQRYDNQPYGTAVTDLIGLVFPEGHPYHHPTIGSMADLDAATLPQVHAFYRRHYHPGATVIGIVGDVDPEQAFTLVERHFGDWEPAARAVPPPAEPLPPLADRPREEHSERVPTERLYVGFRLPVAHTPEFTAASVALDALGGLTVSRLHRTLVRRRDLATGCSAAAMGLVGGSSLGFVGVDVAEGVNPDEVEEVLDEELARFADEGPTELELAASLADTERSWLEATGAQEERADLLSHFTLLHDDPHYLNQHLDDIAAVRPADVRRAAAHWLRPEQRATVAYRHGVGPGQEGAA
ncbi:M16 family metallopeptidase [Ornithinicoccus halotolerans]|uniref:M16 family metallopeptidase n=1 Tax=Ornithinicoccus halotolerans TaxID=1748220 RepID=UPI0012951CCF|nr:pitrilysin family protein [Ornithinicoccus halotolerans]